MFEVRYLLRIEEKRNNCFGNKPDGYAAAKKRQQTLLPLTDIGKLNLQIGP